MISKYERKTKSKIRSDLNLDFAVQLFRHCAQIRMDLCGKDDMPVCVEDSISHRLIELLDCANGNPIFVKNFFKVIKGYLDENKYPVINTELSAGVGGISRKAWIDATDDVEDYDELKHCYEDRLIIYKEVR